MKLLDDVALFLNKIQLDDFQQKKLKLNVASAKQELRRYAPDLDDIDFEDETNTARNLLFQYCLYAESNAVSVFRENYKSELFSLRQEYEVRNSEEYDAYEESY